MNNFQITAVGFKALQKELDKLVNIKRPKLVERLAHAREQGDLAENSDYQSARDELEFLDGRIDELKYVVDNAQVVKISGKNGSVVIGTVVTVKLDNKKQDFEIVGEWEADPVKCKISYSSPLGKALAGKKVGDQVEVEAPAGKIVYKILAIK